MDTHPIPLDMLIPPSSLSAPWLLPSQDEPFVAELPDLQKDDEVTLSFSIQYEQSTYENKVTVESDTPLGPRPNEVSITRSL
jgi:hypothetical protein